MSNYILNAWKTLKTGLKAKVEIKHFDNKFEDYSESNNDIEEVNTWLKVQGLKI